MAKQAGCIKKRGYLIWEGTGYSWKLSHFGRFYPLGRDRGHSPLPLGSRHGRSSTDALGKKHERGFQVYFILGKVLDCKTGINEHFGERGVVLDPLL